MRPARFVLAFVLAGSAGALAQEQPQDLKSWFAAEWQAKAEYMKGHGAVAERDCDEDKACWTTFTAEVAGWTLTMTSGEGADGDRTYCAGKTGGMLRVCRDDRTGETQKFFRSGDEWMPHGK